MSGNLKNDPIALSLKERKAEGGFEVILSEIEAKKKGYRYFRLSKLMLKGMVVIDLLSDYKPPKLESTSPSKKLVTQKNVTMIKKPDSK